MASEKDTKAHRILEIYFKLVRGEVVNKKKVAEVFNVNEKTIQRDLDDIRSYFDDNRESQGYKEIIYRRDIKGYCLSNREDVLTREDVLAITKILLESRAFCKEELQHLANSILGQVSYEQKKCIIDIIGNELFNYAPLKHDEFLLTRIWDLSELIRHKEITDITYIRTDGVEVTRVIKPVSIIFSEYYFYLIAYYEDFDTPTIFRIDRIKEYKMKRKKYRIPESERFEDGEFRKRIQFMYAGELMNVKLEFTGTSIEAILDRLPTAKIIEKTEDKFILEAEVYGKGVMMWILSQGEKLKVLAPDSLVKDIKKTLIEMHKIYSTE